MYRPLLNYVCSAALYQGAIHHDRWICLSSSCQLPVVYTGLLDRYFKGDITQVSAGMRGLSLHRWWAHPHPLRGLAWGRTRPLIGCPHPPVGLMVLSSLQRMCQCSWGDVWDSLNKTRRCAVPKWNSAPSAVSELLNCSIFFLGILLRAHFVIYANLKNIGGYFLV